MKTLCVTDQFWS